MGLNDSYYAPSGNILMISSNPYIPRAYALLMQEDKERDNDHFLLSSGWKKSMIKRILILL